MLLKQIIQIYTYIIQNALDLVNKNVDTSYLSGNVSFASIFAQSVAEYNQFNENLSVNGDIFDNQITGIYYKLHKPLIISEKTITICRVRKYDATHTERGYCDFQVKDYSSFKQKYSKEPNFSLIFNQHGIEMLELKVPNSNIRIYFPNTWA